MKSLIVKRSVVIAGRKTSVSVEDDFWSSFQEIAKARQENLSQLISSINADRKHPNLSSAIRLFVLDFYRVQFDQQQGKAENPQSLGSSVNDVQHLPL